MPLDNHLVAAVGDELCAELEQKLGIKTVAELDADWERLKHGSGNVTWSLFAEVFELLLKELAVDRRRIAALERRPAMKYAGVFKEDKTYNEGEVVTWDGSAWICKKDFTSGRPGANPTGWQLMVKRGADAR